METKLKILHLEDDETSAKLIHRNLTKEGVSCEVQLVHTGTAFAKALRTAAFNLILADYTIPGFDGAEALRMALEHASDVPFIYVTGSLGEEVAIESLKNGATDYVLKDRLSRLVPAVNRAVKEAEEKSRRREAEAKLHSLNAELERRVEERTRQLDSANKELAAMSYSVSHDLRSPLQHILGFSRLLLEEPAVDGSDNLRDMALQIVKAGDWMNSMILGLLEFSKLGQQELNMEECDLGEIWKEVLHEFEPELRELTVKFEVDPLPAVKCDSRLMRSVYQNLLGNSLKYSAMRQVIHIRLAAQKLTDKWQISFGDNGIGFNSSSQEQIFRLFQRFHSDGEFEGTGLGLATVQRIIHRHGGTICADSEPDKGATFHFTLPA